MGSRTLTGDVTKIAAFFVVIDAIRLEFALMGFFHLTPDSVGAGCIVT